jgi:sulfate/thiosulfate transport system permease protein
MPLYIEIMYNDYHYVAAFAVSSLLTLLAIATLIAKHFLERRVIPEKQKEAEEVESTVAA